MFAPQAKFIYSTSFAPNGQMAASGHIDGSVQIFDVANSELKTRLDNHQVGVRAVTFDLASQAVASSGEDLHTYLTDLETG